jgi:hypothetical protein
MEIVTELLHTVLTDRLVGGFVTVLADVHYGP